MNHDFPKELGDYHVTDTVLGRGSFGEVRTGKHKTTSQLVAIKQVYLKPTTTNTKMIEYNKGEIKFSKELNHPHIVKLYDHFVCIQSQNFVYFHSNL